MPFNQVHDKVYIRDGYSEWLPCVVLEIDDDRALVGIELPSDWNETTLIDDDNKATYSYNELNHQQRWVLLKDYYDRQLPLQNNRGICRNMAELTQVHEAEILYQIKARYTRTTQNPYTRVADMIVATNPGGKSINGLYSIDRQVAYANKFLSNAGWGSSKKPSLEEKKEDHNSSYSRDVEVLTYEPHVYEISSLAYKNIVSSSKTKRQTIIVSGESGTGKTETSKLILQHMAALPDLLSQGTTSQLNQESCSSDELVQRVIESSRILEAFGNARTCRHSNSSRFAKVVQLQYSIKGKQPALLGSSIDTYLLEASRVVTTPLMGECNFHIFYQLLASSSGKKRALLGEKWSGASYQDFRYLKSTNIDNVDNSSSPSYVDDWENTLNAMKLFCWEGASLKMVIQALGTILRIGNIAFDMNAKGEAIISSKDDLVLLAEEMDLPLRELELALTGRNIVTAYQETIRVAYTVGSATEARDALAKAIYASLFASIVRQINLLTCSPASQCNVISVVDVFGFNFSGNGQFQQFCMNYVNERLQQKYFRDVLWHCKQDFDEENIELPQWKDFDNSLTLDLLEGSSGIISLLNKQTVGLNGSSEVFASEVKHVNRNHERLVKGKSQKVTQFSVRHFAGAITYDGTKFVECNRTIIPDDLITICAKCSNPLVSQELVKITSSSHKRNLSFDTINVKNNAKSTTVMEKLKNQLNELTKSIDYSETHYVRCMKPSEKKTETRLVDHILVLRQLRNAGLVHAVEVARDTYARRLPFQIVEQRFACLIDNICKHNIKDMELHDRVQIMMSILFSPVIELYRDSDFSIPFVCGKTKIFFRAGALEILESRRLDYLAAMATRLQKWERKVLMKQRFKAIQGTIIRIQAIARKRPVRRAYENKRLAAVVIQTTARSLQPKKYFKERKRNAVIIQRSFRVLLMKQNFKRMSQAATKISNWRQGQIYRNALFRKRWFSTMIPIYLKAMKKLRCYDAKKRQKLTRTIQQTYTLFTHKVPFRLLEERFTCLIPPSSVKPMIGMEDHDKAQLMMLMLFSPFIEECRNNNNFPMPFACGKTRVYFRPGSLEVLEILRREHYTTAVLKLQQWTRRVTSQRHYQNTRNAIIRIQNHARYRNTKNSTSMVFLYARTLKGMGYVKPVYKTALVKALKKSKKVFPYTLPYSVAIDRFSTVVPHKYARSMHDMDPSDKAKHIMSVLFTPFTTQFKSNDIPMPFSCKDTGLYLRVGSLELLEILRTEKLDNSAIIIQSWFRSMLQEHTFRESLVMGVKLQAWCRRCIEMTRFSRYRQSVVVLQKWARSMQRNKKEKMKRQAAAIRITSMARIFVTRVKQERESTRILTAWARSLTVIKNYKAKRAVTVLQAQFRRKRAVKVYHELKKSTISVYDCLESRKTQRFKSLRNRRGREGKFEKHQIEEPRRNLSPAGGIDYNSSNAPIVVDQEMSAVGILRDSDDVAESERISKPVDTAGLVGAQICNLQLMAQHLQYPDISIGTPESPKKGCSTTSTGAYDSNLETRREEMFEKSTGQGVTEIQAHKSLRINGFEDGLIPFDLSEISLNESIYESSDTSDQSIAKATDFVTGGDSFHFDSSGGKTSNSDQHSVYDTEPYFENQTNQTLHTPQARDPTSESSHGENRTRETTHPDTLVPQLFTAAFSHELLLQENAEEHISDQEITSRGGATKLGAEAGSSAKSSAGGMPGKCTADVKSDRAVLLPSGSFENPAFVLNRDKYAVVMSVKEQLSLTQSLGLECTEAQYKSRQNDEVEPSSSTTFLEKERFYKAQVESLRHDIMQVTAEADIHNEEIEAEYEERLAAYESEVLQLHQNIKSLEDERAELKKNFVLAKESYEEYIKHLKEAMKRAEDSHRTYLKQVVASVEKSKIENAKALESVKQSRDTQIRHLEEMIERLKNDNSRENPNVSHNIQGQAAAKEAQRLARKLEKIISPQHIIKVSEAFRLEPQALQAKVDEKISYKARNIIGRMERIVIGATASPRMINVIADEAEREVHNLEQQLVHAYEEIEKLDNELAAFKTSSRYKQVSRRQKRPFF